AGTVVAARTAGMSWAEVADRLGTSRQAVWKRFGPEEVDPPSPRTYSSCASYKAVTTRPPWRSPHDRRSQRRHLRRRRGRGDHPRPGGARSVLVPALPRDGARARGDREGT